jgi:hypothetical protein
LVHPLLRRKRHDAGQGHLTECKQSEAIFNINPLALFFRQQQANENFVVTRTKGTHPIALEARFARKIPFSVRIFQKIQKN